MAELCRDSDRVELQPDNQQARSGGGTGGPPPWGLGGCWGSWMRCYITVGAQPWPKEQLDVFAAGRGLQTRLHFLVFDNEECWGCLNLESLCEFGSLPDLDTVDHEGLMVAAPL